MEKISVWGNAKGAESSPNDSRSAGNCNAPKLRFPTTGSGLIAIDSTAFPTQGEILESWVTPHLAPRNSILCSVSFRPARKPCKLATNFDSGAPRFVMLGVPQMRGLTLWR